MGSFFLLAATLAVSCLLVQGQETVPEPTLRQGPEENYYVLESEPVLIECRAAYASEIMIVCAGDTRSRDSNNRLRDPENQVAGTVITAADVEGYINRYGPKSKTPFWCECRLLDKDHNTVVTSNRTIVNLSKWKPSTTSMPPWRGQSTVARWRRQATLPPWRRQSTMPPIRRRSTLPPWRRRSTLPPWRRLTTPDPSCGRERVDDCYPDMNSGLRMKDVCKFISDVEECIEKALYGCPYKAVAYYHLLIHQQVKSDCPSKGRALQMIQEWTHTATKDISSLWNFFLRYGPRNTKTNVD